MNINKTTTPKQIANTVKKKKYTTCSINKIVSNCMEHLYKSPDYKFKGSSNTVKSTIEQTLIRSIAIYSINIFKQKQIQSL